MPGTSSGGDAQPVGVVDRDDGTPAAAAEALDRPQRRPCRPGSSRPRGIPSAPSNASRTCWAPTTAHETFVQTSTRCSPTGVEVELVVERRDRLDVRGRLLEGVGHLAQHVGRQPAVLGLRQAQRRQDGRLRVRRVLRPLLLDRLVQAHRSTSPITPSSEPTIAIMSAISASVMQVAVACSATNDGARNFTRHGFGPPSEQT